MLLRGKRPYEVDLRERADFVAVKAADLEFVRAQLGAGAPTEAKRLPAIDPGRSAVIGHSFGGGAAADICQRQDPPTFGVSLDGGLWRAPEPLSPTGPFLRLAAPTPSHLVARAARPQEADRAGVWNTVTGALLTFLGKHLRGDEGDVLATLTADDALRVCEPAKLFPPDSLASA